MLNNEKSHSCLDAKQRTVILWNIDRTDANKK